MEVIKLVIKDYAKEKALILSFTLQLLLSIFCLLLVATQFMDGLSDITIINETRRSNIVGLRMQSTSNIMVNDERLQISLSSVLSDYKTYTWYTDNESDYTIIHMFGKYANLLGELKQSNESYLVYGEGIERKIVDAKANDYGIRKESILKKNSFFDSRNGSVSLNKSMMIVNQSTIGIHGTSSEQFDQLLHNLHIFDSRDVEVKDIVSVLSNETNFFYPRFINESTRFEQVFTNDSILLLFFSIVFVFILLNLYLSLYDIVRSNLREYAIHRLYGATMNQITMRIEVFVLIIYLIPGLLLACYFGDLMSTRIPTAYYFVILMAGQLTVTTPIKLTILNKDISSLLRSDNS